MNFLEKKSIGIDISDDTIEVVELIKHGSSIEILNRGRSIINPGIIEHGRIKDIESLSLALKSVLKKSKPSSIDAKKVFIAIADSLVYEHIFNVTTKIGGQKDMKNLVSQAIEQSIPIKESNLVVDHMILGKKDGKTDIMITAIEREVIIEWQDFFNSLDIEIENIDIEPSAIFRGLFSKAVGVPTAIIDIGANTTKVSIFNKQGLRYSHIINIAGNKLTSDLVEEKGIGQKEAEKIKIDGGLEGDGKEILQESILPLAKELLALLGYFEKKSSKKIENIILIGGSSKMKGLESYLTDYLKVNISLGKSVIGSSKTLFDYIEAIGLALRPMRGDKLVYGLSIDNIKKHKTKKKKDRDKEKSKKVVNSKIIKESDNQGFKKNNSGDKKLLFQKIVLFVIIILGIIIITLSFMYRDYDRNNRIQPSIDQNNL